MARPLRIEYKGAFYHITSRGNERRRIYLENGIGDELENPLSNIYGGAILGGASFIKESINRLKGGILNRDETS